MDETPTEAPEAKYELVRRSDYTILQPHLYDYRLSFNQETSDVNGNDMVAAVRIENLNLSGADEYPVELTREAAIDLAKAILAEANETFLDYELEGFQNRGCRI